MNQKRASLPFGWIITEDHLQNNDVGAENYSDPKPADSEYTVGFKMYDDDGELYYVGVMTPSCEDWYGYGRNNPLDDFGLPNAGCTYMETTSPGGNDFSIL